MIAAARGGLLLITGTGTGVGKTVTTAAVAALAAGRGERVAVVKPAQTGVPPDEPGDVAEVLRLAGLPASAGVELARYPDPLAPATAARVCGLPAVTRAECATAITALRAANDLVLVEGAGGLLVSYADGSYADSPAWTLADLSVALEAPLLVVAGPALGTLNHTALTLEAAARRGLDVVGVVLGSWPDSPDLACRTNVRDLELLAGRPLSGALPDQMARLDPGAFAAAAAVSLGPELGGVFDAADFGRRYHVADRREQP